MAAVHSECEQRADEEVDSVDGAPLLAGNSIGDVEILVQDFGGAHWGFGHDGALVFVHLAAVADLHHEYDIGRFDAVDHAVVADAEAAGASEAVAQGFAELEGVCGELGFDLGLGCLFQGTQDVVGELVGEQHVLAGLHGAEDLRHVDTVPGHDDGLACGEGAVFEAVSEDCWFHALMELQAGGLARKWPPGLVVDAEDAQRIGLSPIEDSKGWDGPAAHFDTWAKRGVHAWVSRKVCAGA